MDPDVPSSLPQGLSFAWACQQFDGVRVAACRDASLILLVLSDTAVVTVPANTLLASDEFYVFTVTVRKGLRSSSKAIPVTVVAGLIPSMSITAVQGAVEQSDGSYMVNSNAQITFFAASDLSEVAYRWSIIPARALSNPQIVPFGINRSTFILRDLLVPGSTYTIRLSGTSNQLVGSSLVHLTVNRPPVMGTFSACLLGTTDRCEKSGQPIIDTYLLSAVGFSDPDGLIQYQFGWYVTGATSTSVTWLERSILPSREIELPSGVIRVLLRVFDVWDAVSPTLEVTHISVFLSLPP